MADGQPYDSEWLLVHQWYLHNSFGFCLRFASRQANKNDMHMSLHPRADRTLVEESCEASTLVPKCVIKVPLGTALKCMGLHSALTVPLQCPYNALTVPIGKTHSALILSFQESIDSVPVLSLK